MARKALFRVDFDQLPRGVQKGPPHVASQMVVKLFKRMAQDYNILHEIKEREYYQSPGEKRRLAKRRSEVARKKEEARQQEELKNGKR